jgi:hypothetical protein
MHPVVDGRVLAPGRTTLRPPRASDWPESKPVEASNAAPGEDQVVPPAPTRVDVEDLFECWSEQLEQAAAQLGLNPGD